MKALGLVVVLLIACGSSLQEDDAPMVETPLGWLRGSYGTSRAGRRYMAFTGIPYAKPPIGELRFKAPEPPLKWEGVLDATNGGPQCLQNALPGLTSSQIGMSEDCLRLDVYTHDTNPSRKAPVLVNIHGGAFVAGFKEVAGVGFFMDEDVVVVRMNYRLAIFGFLSFETKDQTGNQGLKDQMMALRWVKENIASFGGDPDKVTIMGQSAGGGSVYHHLLSPLSRGLFHRAVSTSGSSYCPWALSAPGVARKNAEKLMKLLDCPTTPEEGIQCARNKDANEILEKTPLFTEFQGIDPMVKFAPVLEVPGTPGAFLDTPMSKWETAPVPFLPIVSSAEGIFRVAIMLIPSETLGASGSVKELTDDLEKNLPITLGYWASASNPNEVTKKVWDFYFPGKKELDIMGDLVNLTMMYSDSWFNHGIIKGANMHKGPVYFWWFDYHAKGVPEEPLNLGSTHCSDAVFMWDFSDFPVNLGDLKSPEFVDKSEKIVQAIVRFMETGEPNIPGSDSKWKPWTADEDNYLHFDKNGYQMKTGLIPERYKFWDSLNFQDILYKQTNLKTEL